MRLLERGLLWMRGTQGPIPPQGLSVSKALAVIWLRARGTAAVCVCICWTGRCRG